MNADVEQLIEGSRDVQAAGMDSGGGKIWMLAAGLGRCLDLAGMVLANTVGDTLPPCARLETSENQGLHSFWRAVCYGARLEMPGGPAAIAEGGRGSGSGLAPSTSIRFDRTGFSALRHLPPVLPACDSTHQKKKDAHL